VVSLRSTQGVLHHPIGCFASLAPSSDLRRIGDALIAALTR
jgi:hypothetical protein